MARHAHRCGFDFRRQVVNFQAEVEIPPKRIMIVPKRDTTAVTPDGRFMLVANMTPATSVSVVDLKARKFAGEIETPGCVQALAPGNRQFSSMCADGSILTVQLDDSGAAKEKKQSKPFFDPNKDAIFDQPAVAGTTAYFDSYHGAIHVLDLSGAEAAPAPEWSITRTTPKNRGGPADGRRLLSAKSARCCSS